LNGSTQYNKKGK